MAYTKQTWQCGDVVTAEKLNHIEEGIEECCGGGAEPLIVNYDHTETIEGGTVRDFYDKTWQQVHDAMPNVLVKVYKEELDPDTSDTYITDESMIMTNVDAFTANGTTTYTAIASATHSLYSFEASSAQGTLYTDNII